MLYYKIKVLAQLSKYASAQLWKYLSKCANTQGRMAQVFKCALAQLLAQVIVHVLVGEQCSST